MRIIFQKLKNYRSVSTAISTGFKPNENAVETNLTICKLFSVYTTNSVNRKLI